MTDASWSAAELADQIRDGDVDAHIDAVLADDQDVGDVMLTMEHAGVDDGPLAEMLSRKGQTDMLRQARQSGDVASMNAATGLSESRTDATGYQRLIDACRPAAQQILIKGPKGSGKTAKALEIVRRLWQDDIIDKVLTNIGRDDPDDPAPEDHDAVEFAEDISRYLEFAKEPGEKVAIFDEFSTSGNAYTGQSDVEAVMSRTINAFRKSEGGSLRTIFIGHENDNDIHPLVKKQSDVVIQADGKVDEGLIDCITVYRGWNAYMTDEVWFRVRGLRDIPEWSDWNYSTNYFAHLEWDLDEPEKQINRGQLIDNWEAYQEPDEDPIGDGSSDEATKYVDCRGTKTDGSDCGATVTHESGYCHAHRSQWDGEPDPRLEGDT
ncbi:homolog to virus protein HRPV1-VP8 [Natronomonas pharaonis DSM 2160]|uniref:Homolog to virus protein HRPV1-VP8 n=1 Tax=Natronomonas pharaonis (strain ATCC 35678 / DSM 2160 / CIP 103997 / JCM 8858 / NBRC 14720 / NCIMB 2260 / Gabara) TaxID=348780 RepID=A0A1U7EZL5_NATPD|nr:ATP-binding protein [Natronomonas pharaonis]CAI50762.1 homolog to virus protein HRPV1-VP8 [Natronomonas pharaonis DSM 2160]